MSGGAVPGVDAAGLARDPYYAAPAVRFEPRNSDVLRSPGDVVVARAPCGSVLESGRARARVEVCGVSEAEARAIVRSVDGDRSLLEAQEAAGVPLEAWDTVLRAAFGVVLFAPAAVVALEARVSAAEIVRYPSSPYEVVRAYWENMADLAERLEGSEGVPDGASFKEWLRELHVLALSGSSGRSSYVPASPIAAKERIVPGELIDTPSVLEETARGTRFVSGPRVNATALGSEVYGALLAESVGDAEAVAPNRLFTDSEGLSWGRLSTARADPDAESARWFCPPRPLKDAHFEALRRALALARSAAAGGDRAVAVSSLARLHQRFVRLHPFSAGNQGLAMSLVNHVLRRVFGAGIPHLVLDHLALSLSEPAYEATFRLASDGWLVLHEDPVERLRALVDRRRRSFELLGRLTRVASVEDARELVRRDPEAARWSLLGGSR